MRRLASSSWQSTTRTSCSRARERTVPDRRQSTSSTRRQHRLVEDRALQVAPDQPHVGELGLRQVGAGEATARRPSPRSAPARRPGAAVKSPVSATRGPVELLVEAVGQRACWAPDHRGSGAAAGGRAARCPCSQHAVVLQAPEGDPARQHRQPEPQQSGQQRGRHRRAGVDPGGHETRARAPPRPHPRRRASAPAPPRRRPRGPPRRWRSVEPPPPKAFTDATTISASSRARPDARPDHGRQAGRLGARRPGGRGTTGRWAGSPGSGTGAGP